MAANDTITAEDLHKTPSDAALAVAQKQAQTYQAGEAYAPPAQLPYEPGYVNQGPELTGSPLPVPSSTLDVLRQDTTHPSAQAGSLATASRPQTFEPQPSQGPPQGGSLATAGRGAPPAPAPQVPPNQGPELAGQQPPPSTAGSLMTASQPDQTAQQPQAQQPQQQDGTISAADLQQGESISAKDLVTPDQINQAVNIYKTPSTIENAYASGQIHKEVATGALNQLRTTYDNSNPDQQKAMDAADAEAKKQLTPKPDETSTATPAADTFANLVALNTASGTDGNFLAKIPFQQIRDYVDLLHKNGKLDDTAYANSLDEIQKAKNVLQNIPLMGGGYGGLGTTQSGIERFEQAQQEIATHLDLAAPGFLNERVQQAIGETKLAGRNIGPQWKDFLTWGPHYNQPPDPTGGPDQSYYQKSANQISASLDKAYNDHQANVAKYNLTDKDQQDIAAEMKARGMLYNTPEFMENRLMTPRPGASTGGLPLIREAAIAGLSAVAPVPWGKAVDEMILPWLFEKGAYIPGAIGKGLEGKAQSAFTRGLKYAWGGVKTGATVTGEQIAFHPQEFWQDINDPAKRTQTLEILAGEFGLPIVGGALLGSGIFGTKNAANFVAAVMRSASPEIKMGIDPVTGRAISSEIPYRATQNPFVQMAGRAVGSYTSGALKYTPYAAALSGGDFKQFLDNANQFGLYHTLANSPQNMVDAIRGGTLDHLFTYKGEDPNTTKAPPTTKYGDSYYHFGSGQTISLDPYVEKAINSFDPSRQATIRHAQDIVKPYGNIYPLPDDVFEHIAKDQGADPNQAGFVNHDVLTGRTQAFFRASEFDTSALHEGIGHVADAVMGPQNQAGFNHLLSKVLDMDQLANTYANRAKPGTGKVTFDQLPSQAEVTVGDPQYDPAKAQWSKDHANLTKEQAFAEARAETLQALWSGDTAENWTKNPSLLRQFAYYIGAGAEGMGFRATTPDVDGPVAVGKSVGAGKMIDAFLRDFSNGNIPPGGATKNYFGGAGAPWAPGHGPAMPTQPGPVPIHGGTTPAGVVPAAPAPTVVGGGGAGGFGTAKPANVIAVRGAGGQILPQQTALPGKPIITPPPETAPPETPPETGPEAIPEKPQPEKPEAETTPEQHAAIEEARNKGTPAGRAQAEAQGKKGQTLQETGEEKPQYMPAAAVDVTGEAARGTMAGEGPGTHGHPEQPTKRTQLPPVAPLAQPKGADADTSRQMRATWFGRNPDGSIDRTDEGRMSMYNAHHGAWGADLLDSKLKGVALGRNFLAANGIDARKSPGSQGYRVRVTAPNGKSEVTDIVDIGPENKVDMTYGLGKSLGLNDNSQLKVELLDHQGKTLTLKDPERGGTAYMPSGEGTGGGGPTNWTPSRGPAPSWTGGGAAPAAPGAEEARAPAPTYPSQADVEPETVPTAPISYMPSGGGYEAQMPSQAEQMAQYQGTFGGGFGYGQTIPGIVPGAPGPSYMPRRKMGGIEPEEEGGAPVESTLGEPNVPGFEGLAQHLNQGQAGLKRAQAMHAKLLSPDDSRVKLVNQGGKNYFKGEHFVEGDPVHAAALADVPTHERVGLAAGQTAIANKQPMHMSYASAPPAAESPITRQSREVNYEASSPQARLLGQTNARLAGHSIVPVALGISQPQYKGDTSHGYIQGISTSVAAHNHHQINRELANMGEESPYPEIGTPKFRNDMAGYIQNLLAGHRGTGNKYQVSTPDFPANIDRNYVPYRLKQKEADFMNAIINNTMARYSPKLRELARTAGTLQTEQGEVNPMLHRIDQEHIHDPAIDRAAKQTWRTQTLEPTIRTFNTGLIHALHATREHIPEEIRPNVPGYEELTKTLGQELTSEKGRPDIPMAAAFMPRGKPAKRPPPLSPEEHEELTGNIRKQFLGGKLRTGDYLERLHDVPEPGEEIGPAYMPMAGRKARGFAQAEKEGRTFETPLPGGGKRFEIDDRPLEFKPPAKPVPPSWSTVGGPRNALEESYLNNVRGRGEMPLSNAIRHPDLFENYPHLRNTKISMDPTLPHLGHYQQPYLDENGNPRGDEVFLKNPDDKDTLVHELQHAIQLHENFAGKGANTEAAEWHLRANTGVHDELNKEWEAAYPERAQMTAKELNQNDDQRTDWKDKKLKAMAYALYQMNPGEIEARVAGKRAMHQSDEQRAEVSRQMGLPETYERITPRESVLDEMREAARYGREAGTLSERRAYRTPKAGLEPGIAYMARGKKKAAPVPEGAEPPLEKPSNWDEQPEHVRQAYLEKKVADTLANAYRGPETHELKVLRNKKGGIQYDPAGNPRYEKHDYDIVNSPLLGEKGLNQIASEKAKEHEDVIDPEEHKYLKPIERRRLSALRNASAVSTMGDKILDSYMKIKDKPAIMAGEGWYSRMRKKLADALGEHHELFAQLLGATSAKTPVRNNFIQALDALEQFKEGKAGQTHEEWLEGLKNGTNHHLGFNRHIAKYQEAYEKLKEGGVDALVAHMKAQGVPLFKVDKRGNRTDVEDHDSDAAAMANWITHHQIMPKQKIQPGADVGQKYNANSQAVLRALAGTWLEETKAPKTPNFAGNLTGRSLEATIDVWAARHIQRLGYEGLNGGKPWRALAQAEPGVKALDFAYSQDAMRDAADKITKATGKKMNPDDLQAILWFAEKHHYEEQKWTRGAGAKKSSFDDVADLAFPKSGKPMTSDDLRQHYQKIALAKEGLERYENHPKQAMRDKLAGYMRDRGIEQHHIDAARLEPEEEEEPEAEEEEAA